MSRNNTQRYEPVVTLNSKAAEDALEGLRVKAKQVREALNQAGKMGDDRKVKELDRELKSIEATQRKIRQQTYDYNTVLRNLNTSSIKDLEKTAKALKNEIRQLSPGTQEFVEKSRQLDRVRGRIDQLNGRVRETHSWFSRVGNSFNRYFGMATAAVASVTGISLALRGAAQEAAKLDDIYADVMKTTGLLREEVVWLNDEFKKLNTRTSRDELNYLARDAGKLGIAGKENVLEFVRAANQIKVALSEDLGEGAIRNIGKLSEVFKLTQQLGIEKSFLSIGSAINALGQASTAQEQYLVDFTQRIAGVAYQAGMSIENVLGFASALDQSGQKVEMSATAIQKFLLKMFSDTTTFAKMANMEVSEFSRLLRSDVNEAILTVLSSLNEKGGFAQLVPIFQDMGLDGARAVSVLSALATNVDLVREAQTLSNKEFALATDLTREYNVKNENMQARLEKARKAFKDQVITLGEQLSPAFLKTTKLTTLFLKAIMNINKEFIAAAAIFLATIVAYKSWAGIVAIGNTLMTSARLITLAWSTAMALLRGNTVRAAAAWKMFNASFSTTAIGAAITAIVALGYGLYKLITYQTELTKATKEYYAETQKAKMEAEALIRVLETSVVGSEEYKTALSKLVELYGPYIAHLIDERGYLTDIKDARMLINTAIEETIGLKIKEATVAEITNKSLKKQSDYYEDIVKTLQKQAGLTEDVARIYATNFTNSIRQGKEWNEVVNDLFRKVNTYFQIRPFRQFANEYNKMLSDIAATEKKFEFVTPLKKQSGTEETEAQKKARLAKEKAEADALAAEERERLKKEAEERAKLMEELFKKELSDLDRKEREKEVLLRKKYMESNLSRDEFDALMTDKTISFLEKRNALYIKFNKDNSSVENAYYQELIKLADASYKKMQESMKIMDKWIKKMKEAKEETDFETKEDKAFWDHYNQLIKDAEKVKTDFAERSWKTRREKEMKNLDELLRWQLITQEEYEAAVKKVKLDAAISATEEINSIVQSIADFSASMQEREYSRLEQEKERELALYGDNADARAEIEQKYEQKKLELQKKYADIDMVLKIAQTISAGAQGIMTAIGQLGAFAGPAIAFISLTTAMSVATIVAQRNAIKNASVASSGDTTGKRIVNEYYEGGFTSKDRSDNTPVGVVHANEWVAPAAMVRANPVVFASLERERVHKYSMQSPMRKFASGGYASNQSNADDSLSIILSALLNEIKALKNTPLKAYTVLDEANAANELRAKMRKEGSL